MPFGLRNAGATYQRLVDKAFHKQIDRNLEVYMDDLIIKSRTKDEIVRDIEETFKTLREFNMKLNPKKCAFGVEEGMFLGYKVNAKGLKICPDKVDVFLSLPSPKCLKDVQKLNEKLASLNRALRGLEQNYTSMETLVLALVHASNCLKRSFQAHPIIVITDQPIQQILSRPKVAGRLQKWSIELEEYAIHNRPKVSVKGHILADFIVERPEEDSLDTPMEEERELPEPWNLCTDGFSCTDGSEAGLILTNPERTEFTYALRFRFDVTNNEAQYEALIARLRISEQMGVKNLQANVDSCIVANQVNETYVTKEADMIRYLEKIEAKPVATITDNQIKKFVWDNIVCRFGIPEEIISDSGKQFWDDPFKDWCEKLYICQHIASVKHPQTNGLVERANRSLGKGIKATVDARSKNWMEELRHVLWAHRTMIKSSNGDTPFSLTYGTEGVILAEIGMPTVRTAEVDLVGNNEALEINLDLLKERREEAAIREAKSKAKMEKYYNAKVRNTSFKPRDLV
nr:reverse transcriptase domain-containing protein [Tanacetum cinerariifolium]